MSLLVDNLCVCFGVVLLVLGILGAPLVYLTLAIRAYRQTITRQYRSAQPLHFMPSFLMESNGDVSLNNLLVIRGEASTHPRIHICTNLEGDTPTLVRKISASFGITDESFDLQQQMGV